MQLETDTLTSLARQMVTAGTDSVYSKLVIHGPGDPAAKELLDGVKADELFTGSARPSQDNAAGALAGLWLWRDWLTQSHLIAQSMHSITGSFWHAIVHRREGDFSNARYWYAKAAGHPALQILPAQAGSILNSLPADKSLFKIIATGWNPDAFVDLVEAVHEKPTDERYETAVALQKLEWRVLFGTCVRQ